MKSHYFVFFLLYGTISFSQQNPISKKDVNRTTYVANAVYKVNSMHDYTESIYAAYVNGLVRENPNIKTREIVSQIQKFREHQNRLIQNANGNYKAPTTPIEATNSFITILAAVAPDKAKFATPIIQEVLKWSVKGYESYKSINAQMDALNNLEQQNQLISKYQEKEWSDLWSNSQNLPEVRKAANLLFSSILKANTYDDSITIISRNPNFQSNMQIAKLFESIGPNGELTISIKDFQEYAKEEFNSLNTEIEKVNATNDSINKMQKNLLDFYLNSQILFKEQAHKDFNIEASRSALYIISTFISLKDSELGKKIDIIGNTAIKLYSSVDQFNPADMTGASMMVLTGNIIQVGMMLTTIGEKNTDQIILEQLGKIQEQIEEVRLEMNSRFDQVDITLATMWKSMNKYFNIICIDIINSRDALYNIQAGLFELKNQLNNLDLAIINALEAGFNRPLINYLVYCLTANPLLDIDFSKCISDLRTYCVFHSFDDLSNSTNFQSLSDASLYDKLDKDLARNVNNLVGLSYSTIQKPEPPSRFPNYVNYTFVANAYIELLLKRWDNYSNLVSSNTTTEILEIGNNYQANLREFIKIENGTLLNSILNEYNKESQIFLDRIEFEKEKYENEKFHSINIWGNVEDATVHEDSLSFDVPDNLFKCEFTDNAIDARTLFKFPLDFEKVIDPIFKLGDRLNIEKLRFCIYPDWTFPGNLSPANENGFRFTVFGRQDTLVTVAKRAYVPFSSETGGNTALMNKVYLDSVVNGRYFSKHGDNDVDKMYLEMLPILSEELKSPDMLNLRDYLLHRNDTTYINSPLTRDKYLELKKLSPANLQSIGYPFIKTFFMTDASQLKKYKKYLSEKIELKIFEQRSDFAKQIIKELQIQSEIQSISDKISLLKKIIESILILGYTGELQNNDILRACLYGEDSLFERKNILQFIQSDQGNNLMNIRSQFKKRSNVFKKLFEQGTFNSEKVELNTSFNSLIQKLESIEKLQKMHEKDKK